MLRERNSSRFERKDSSRERKTLDFQHILGKMIPWGIGVAVAVFFAALVGVVNKGVCGP